MRSIIKDDKIAEETGKKIISFLDLNQQYNGRINTEWGTKTPAGLARSLKRIIIQMEKASDV